MPHIKPSGRRHSPLPDASDPWMEEAAEAYCTLILLALEHEPDPGQIRFVIAQPTRYDTVGLYTVSRTGKKRELDPELLQLQGKIDAKDLLHRLEDIHFGWPGMDLRALTRRINLRLARLLRARRSTSCLIPDFIKSLF